MSRVAKMPITLPKGVECSVTATNVTVKGPKGSLSLPKMEGVGVKVDGSQVQLSAANDGDRKLAGTDTGAPYQPTAAAAPTPPGNALMPPDGIPTLSLAQFAALTGMEIPDQAPAVGENGVALATGPVDAAPEPDPLATDEPAPEGIADGVPVSPGETPV